MAYIPYLMRYACLYDYAIWPILYIIRYRSYEYEISNMAYCRCMDYGLYGRREFFTAITAIGVVLQRILCVFSVRCISLNLLEIFFRYV